MGGIKPIGSEKLQGIDKIRRMIEISRYNENFPQSVNETKSTEYSVYLADGNLYNIEKERQGYIIKMAINESNSDYIDPMKGRKYYSSYSQALKRLNLMAREINVLHENEEGISLIGEQKKKFILKTKKKTTPPVDLGTPPPADLGTPPPPADLGTPPPPADLGTPPPPADLGTPPPPDMGGDMGAPPPDMGGDMGAPPPDMGGDMGAPPPDMEGDMGAPPPDMEGDMGAPPPDMEGDMGAPPPDMEGEELDDEKPKEKKVSEIKRIQILVGKLAQKIRSYEEERDLSNKEVKYIVNSILSAIDVDVLDEDDIEQIISKLEGIDNEEEEEDDSFGDEDTETPPEVMPEPPQEPEMAESYNTIGDAYNAFMKSAYTSSASKKLTSENEFEDYDPEDYHLKRRNRRIYNPTPERFTHGTFAESSVDKLLSKYFIISEDEKNQYELDRERKSNKVYQNNKQNIIRLSESTDQLDSALEYIKENPRVKLIGLSTKGNLIFKEGINEVKVTKFGKLI
jgi:hypothetical protein